MGPAYYAVEKIPQRLTGVPLNTQLDLLGSRLLRCTQIVQYFQKRLTGVEYPRTTLRKN